MRDRPLVRREEPRRTIGRMSGLSCAQNVPRSPAAAHAIAAAVWCHACNRIARTNRPLVESHMCAGCSNRRRETTNVILVVRVVRQEHADGMTVGHSDPVSMFSCPANARRSPAARHRKPPGRLVQRLLGRLSDVAESQPLDTIEFAEIAVESAEGQVTGFPSNLQDQAI